MTTVEQEEHIQRILNKFKNDMPIKYRKGQAEHGGNLWDMKIIDAAIEEALDMYVYLVTLKEQIANMHFHKL